LFLPFFVTISVIGAERLLIDYLTNCMSQAFTLIGQINGWVEA